MDKKAKFITIEGVDGAGKSSFIEVIKNYLEEKGEKVVITREPGGTKLGEDFREFLLEVKMGLMTETLLMFAARAEHIETVINPALEEGKWVICDRFTDSTIAYQCAAKGLPESKVKSLQEMVQGDLKPGMSLIFEVPLNVSKERLKMTGKTPDKFESEPDEFRDRVIKGYKNIAKKDPTRCKLIDSSGTKEQTKEQVMVLLESFYDEISDNTNKKKMKP